MAFLRSLSLSVLVAFGVLLSEHPSGRLLADEGPMLQVTVGEAIAHRTEDESSTVVARIPRGTRLWALETRGDYFRVNDPKSGNVGWIWNRHASPQSLSSTQKVLLQEADLQAERADELYENEMLEPAIAIYEKVLKTRQQILGEDHPETADAYASIGTCHLDLERYDQAVNFFRKALDTRERVLGKDHFMVAHTCIDLGAALDNTDDAENEKLAEQLFLRAVPVLELADPEEAADTLQICLSNLAIMSYAKADYANAILYGRRAIAVAKRIYDGGDAVVTDLEYSLADSYYQNDESEKAEAILVRLLEKYRRVSGEDSADVGDGLHLLGMVLHDVNRFQEAEAALRQALKIRTAESGPRDIYTAYTMHQLAAVLQSLTRYQEAADLFRSAVEIHRAELGEDDWDTLSVTSGLANVLSLMSKNDEAEALQESIVASAIRLAGELDEDTAWYQDDLANTYLRSMKLDKAEEMFNAALKTRRELLEGDTDETAGTLIGLGVVRERRGDLTAAEKFYREGLEMYLRASGENNPAVAQTITNLGWIHYSRGEYAPALTEFERALKIRRKLTGESHLDFADSLYAMASVHGELGDYDKADELLQQALAIQKQLAGAQSVTVAQTIAQLGWVADLRGDPSKSAELIQQSYDITVQHLGEEHPDTAFALQNLSVARSRAGQLEEARDMLLRSIEITQRATGGEPTSPHMFSLAGCVYLDMNDLDRAEEFTMKGLQISRKIYGADHPDTGSYYGQLSAISARRGDVLKATQYMDEQRRIVRRHTSRTLPGLSEQTQQKYLNAKFRFDFISALSLGLERKDDTRTASLSAGWLLNGKAVAQEVLAESALLSRAESAPLVKELRSVRDEIARLALRPDSEDRRTQLADLESRQQQLQIKIAEHGLGLQAPDPWISIGTLRDKLSFDSIFVNIARFQIAPTDDILDPHEQEAALKPARYVAWVVPPTGAGAVQVIDLGDADEIDQMVVTVRKQIQQSINRMSRDGETATEAESQKGIAELSARILQPLESALADAKEVILSPDGELWGVSWPALLLSDGSYLVERFRTRFVLSGRELVYQQPERVAVGSPVIFADPDFDLTPGASEATLGGPTFKVRSASGMTFAKLDSSAAEAASVKPSVEGYTRSEARMLLDDAALESEFKNLHRPRILMLSTHGFFQPPPENHSTGSTVGNRESVVFDNPLLRCGLALAGCNKGLESADENTDDGILTGLEIVGTDLRGTELVVLSACETGLGDVKVGEGLAGLRHAFQLAGAQSVVSSLWQVEDNETARLMSLFFSNLAKGMNKSEALRQAQMERITVRRERNGAAHPFFWAAFTLTGN